VGGGNLIAGIARCAKLIHPQIEVIGVQSEAAPAAHDSWRARRMVHARARTFAGGLAADHPGALALSVMLETVDDIVLVGEDDLMDAMATAVDEVGQVLEGAGAAALAALARYSDRWRGKTVVAVLSGGNAEPAILRTTLARPAEPRRRTSDPEDAARQVRAP
jgi:threonine dehydratase